MTEQMNRAGLSLDSWYIILQCLQPLEQIIMKILIKDFRAIIVPEYSSFIPNHGDYSIFNTSDHSQLVRRVNETSVFNRLRYAESSMIKMAIYGIVVKIACQIPYATIEKAWALKLLLMQEFDFDTTPGDLDVLHINVCREKYTECIDEIRKILQASGVLTTEKDCGREHIFRTRIFFEIILQVPRTAENIPGRVYAKVSTSDVFLRNNMFYSTLEDSVSLSRSKKIKVVYYFDVPKFYPKKLGSKIHFYDPSNLIMYNRLRSSLAEEISTAVKNGFVLSDIVTDRPTLKQDLFDDCHLIRR
jgi:hypothetical protein